MKHYSITVLPPFGIETKLVERGSPDFIVFIRRPRFSTIAIGVGYGQTLGEALRNAVAEVRLRRERMQFYTGPVTIGYTAEERCCEVPDREVQLKPGDRLIPMRGWGAALAVQRRGAFVGFHMAIVDDEPRSSRAARVCGYADEYNRRPQEP